MSVPATDPVAEVRRQLRELRAEMRRNGVRKVSPFNGGLSPAEYSANKERFRLETELKRLAEARP